jgi:hypothetical protein
MVNATYNTSSYNGNGTSGVWTIHYQSIVLANCPFFARSPIPISNPGLAGEGIVIHLTNTYLPSGEVAYDEGGVIYAQYGGYPVMVDGPSIALTLVGGQVTSASLWFPSFSGPVGSAAGLDTETLELRLLHSQSVTATATSPNLGIDPNLPISVKIYTPYAEAWVQYLTRNVGFTGLWSCTPVRVCTGPYSPGISLGTVTITIPSTFLTQLTVSTSTFSVALS